MAGKPNKKKWNKKKYLENKAFLKAIHICGRSQKDNSEKLYIFICLFRLYEIDVLKNLYKI